jgi:cytochrome P450
MTTHSLIQLADKEEHASLRSQLNAFFTPENVDAVYTNLRDAVAWRASAVAAGKSVAGAVAADARSMQVDGFPLLST